MNINMSGSDSFGHALGKITANIQTLSSGLSVEATGDDTVESLTDKIDGMLPYPVIEQTRATAAHYAAELIKRRDDHYREQGLID